MDVLKGRRWCIHTYMNLQRPSSSTSGTTTDLYPLYELVGAAAVSFWAHGLWAMAQSTQIAVRIHCAYLLATKYTYQYEAIVPSSRFPPYNLHLDPTSSGNIKLQPGTCAVLHACIHQPGLTGTSAGARKRHQPAVHSLPHSLTLIHHSPVYSTTTAPYSLLGSSCR